MSTTRATAGSTTPSTGPIAPVDLAAERAELGPALYEAVADTVAGVSAACSDFFGARRDAEQNGFSLLSANAVPGTSGLPSLATYAADGYTILTF